MFGIVALAIEFASLAPSIIDAGINIAGLVSKFRAGLDAVDPAERDAQWNEADAAVAALIKRALDPATDSR